MGKIRVQDLAQKMGISNQDLLFKLKSIGVRIEGDDPAIDTDIINAVLAGKKLPHPKEVILRDEATPPTPVSRRPMSSQLARRPAANPLRPGRPRTLIQKVEPRIQTLPPSERPPAVHPGVAAGAAAASAHAGASPLGAAGAHAPAAGGESAHRETPPVQAAGAAARSAEAATAPRTAPGLGAAGLGEVRRSAAPAAAPGIAESRPDKDKKVKKGKKPPLRAGVEEDLTGFKGTLKDLEEDEDPTGSAASLRRGRRALRRADEDKAREEGGKILTFKKAPPQGPVMISEGMTLREFAEKLGVKSRDLIAALFKRGMMANLNHTLEPALAQELAQELGTETMVVSAEEEVQLREEMARPVEAGGRLPRGPVVTIMGHVDHGKTSLLDAIRSSKVTESEFGGITQHIGAYQVEVNGRKIVFLDTPGHEAFTMMRARGAKVTDLVVLVVAADDGVMPQTLEAIDHARAAKVPLVVAINKIDKPNANPDRVRKELADRGLMPEDWGGDTVMVHVSAVKREGINELLEMILLTSDLLELRANPDLAAQGTVLEARKEVGRGIVATVLVQNGKLSVGDIFVAGATWGRVRSMSDDVGRRSKEAGPSTPVEVTGFDTLPEAGDTFQVFADEAEARDIAGYRREQMRGRGLAPVLQAGLSLEQLFSRIQEGEVKELPVVLKADVQGSVEVLRDSLAKLSTDKVKVLVIHAGVGAISTNDVLLASASKAVIVGFNVRPERSATELAEKEVVDVRLHTVIYELMDELRKAMTGLLDPTFREVTAGRAEVRELFKVPRVGIVAGSHVVEGTIPRTATVRLLRDNRVIHEGKIASLRRFKEDVSEVRMGFDCGIGLEKFQDFKPGDVIEAYVREEVAPTL